jgi:hypothetical protein
VEVLCNVCDAEVLQAGEGSWCVRGLRRGGHGGGGSAAALALPLFSSRCDLSCAFQILTSRGHILIFRTTFQ